MINKKYGISQRQIDKYGFKLALDVYEKYDRKCSVCGSVDDLAIHHIDGSGQTENPNNEIDNLQLVCRRCHGSFSGKQSGGKQWLAKQKEFGGYLRKGREMEYRKEYYQKNKEKIRERQKAYYQKNKEVIIKRNGQYRERLKNNPLADYQVK